jgi:hypothetical protein
VDDAARVSRNTLASTAFAEIDTSIAHSLRCVARSSPFTITAGGAVDCGGVCWVFGGIGELWRRGAVHGRSQLVILVVMVTTKSL